MTEIERRALLGDARAQEECTQQGIVLPCPFCGGPATVKSQKVQYGLSGTIISCKKCMVQLYSPDAKAVPTTDGVRNIPIENHRKIGIGRWNTRLAPPIRRCGECKHYVYNKCLFTGFQKFETGYCCDFPYRRDTNNA